MSSLESPPSPHLPPSPPITIPTETNSISTTSPRPRSRSTSLTPSSDTRVIRARVTDPSFGNNALRSAKYSYATMLPKAIYEQFRRLSNFYFLIVAAISFIPDVSPSSPATTTLPLIVVVGFGLARDIYEDLGRKRDDVQRNSRPVIIRRRDRVERHQQRSPPSVLSVPDSDEFFQTESQLPPDEHTSVRTQDVLVGDIVLVRKDEEFPADMLLLYVAGENPVCYASTANLDGESNLKRKLVPNALHSTVTSSHKLSSLSATVHTSQPTPSLYDFNGSLLIDGHAPCPLSTPNLLLRGSILRNSEYVYGLVLYNGPQTKVALNMRHPPSKLGGVERMMNRVVVGMFTVLLIITIITSVLAGVWQGRVGEGQWYMGDFRDDSGVKVALRSIGTFIILFHTFVPISLFVTLEFARIIQGIFIHADTKLRTRDTPVVVKANNLNETLGYVEHIFSDKTGTLTENVMRFMACSAGDTLFDLCGDKLEIQRAVGQGFEPIRHLVLAMATCHNVVPERTSSLDNKPKKYQGESPDEVALVEAARDAGVELVERNLRGLVLRIFEDTSTVMFEVLAELEFTSERKRSSVIVRCPDGRIVLYTKGADSVMTDLLASSVSYSTQVDRYADLFARRGFRTLVYAYRELSEEEYEPWAARYADACNSISNRSSQQADLAMVIERNLELLGVTAVEDKLQQNVPATISFLRQAGIRIWVLTGDKRETAENIGYSSQLLNRNMHVFHIQVGSPEELLYRLEVIELTMSEGFDVGEVLKPLEVNEEGGKRHKRSSSVSENIVAALTLRSTGHRKERELAIIIDGASLAFIDNEEIEIAFLKVASSCKTVICARVTPLQKAAMVQMVRRHQHSNTLAIGDGGNDVSMIQEAHIGIGVIGKEGSQAARAADYSMGEFRHLARLLAVHGRFSYIRTTGVINLSFYKNILFSFTQILFQFYCFASGTTFHDQWIVTAWNSMITLLPPFLYGIFERDLEESTVVRFPSVYQSNWNNRLFSLRTVLEYTMAYSIWHGLVIFFGTLVFFGNVSRINFSSGQDSGFYLTGLAVSTMAVVIVLSKFLLVSHLWTNITIGGSVLSFVLLWALIPVFVTLAHELELEGVLSMLFSSANYHLLWPIVFVTAFMPDFMVLMKRFTRGSNVVGRLQLLEVEEARERRKLRRVGRKDDGREEVWESDSVVRRI